MKKTGNSQENPNNHNNRISNLSNTGSIASDLRQMVYASLFSALMIIGSYLSIPFIPVPIVLTNFFIMLSGLLMNKKWSSGSVALFLLLGMIGLPVFAGGSGGIIHFIGPTGGYLIAYLFSAFTISTISQKGKPSWIKDLIALIAGVIITYTLGLMWLKIQTGLTWEKVFALGLYPFVLGDAVKVAAAIAAAPLLRPIVQRKPTQ